MGQEQPFSFARVPVHPNHIRQLQDFNFDPMVKVMEVCGTHTVALHRGGIPGLLPKSVKLVSGPGCPVCVTPDSFIDEAVLLAEKGYTIATFGDMIRVPGSRSSLEKARAGGADIRVVYSPLDALALAEQQPGDVVFLSVGFETTVPGIAAAVRAARQKRTCNFFLLTGNRIIPPAMTALIAGGSRIDGFLLPGHVSAILGRSGFDFLEAAGSTGVISGFEPGDMVTSLVMLLNMIAKGEKGVRNNYLRIVREEGNVKSREIMEEVFEPEDAEWRGLGGIGKSGLKLRAPYRDMDIREKLGLEIPPANPNPLCQCGKVLAGQIDPPQCPLFKKGCDPDHPKGPCMVSSEGSCGAWYNFG